jgi:hypothetical protein
MTLILHAAYPPIAGIRQVLANHNTANDFGDVGSVRAIEFSLS